MQLEGLTGLRFRGLRAAAKEKVLGRPSGCSNWWTAGAVSDCMGGVCGGTAGHGGGKRGLIWLVVVVNISPSSTAAASKFSVKMTAPDETPG